MNIRTLVILSVILLIVVYFLNKKWIRIRSVCFEEDKVTGVSIKKGIYSSFVVDLKVGDKKHGFSLLNEKEKITLTLPSGKKKVFENISYYERNRINPAE